MGVLFHRFVNSLGMTKKEIAEAAGVDLSLLDRISHTPPRTGTLRRLGKYLQEEARSR